MNSFATFMCRRTPARKFGLWSLVLLLSVYASQSLFANDDIFDSEFMDRIRYNDLQRKDPHSMFGNEEPIYEHNAHKQNCKPCRCDCKALQKETPNYAHYSSLLKRILSMVSQSSSPVSDTNIVYLRVEFSEYEYHKMQEFVYSQRDPIVDLLAIYPILNKLTIDATSQATLDNTWTKYFQECLYFLRDNREITLVLLVSLGIFLLYTWWFMLSRSLFVVVMKGFVLLFILSSCWKWMYLYKKELAKHLAKQSKFANVPAECHPEKMSTWAYIVQWIFSKFTIGQNNCEEYFESVTLDPHWNVNPMDAVADTFWTLVFYPLRVFATALSHFIYNLFEKLPVSMWLPAIALAFSFMILFMIFHFRYRIRLLSLLGGAVLELTPGESVGPSPYRQCIETLSDSPRQSLNEPKENSASTPACQSISGPGPSGDLNNEGTVKKEDIKNIKHD